MLEYLSGLVLSPLTNMKTCSRTIPTDSCKFCRSFVDLDNEGVTFRDGSCAHESCADGDDFSKQNESDFRD